MVHVLGGVQSTLFAEFVLLFSCGFLALQAGYAKIISLIEIMCNQSSFPCFQGKWFLHCSPCPVLLNKIFEINTNVLWWYCSCPKMHSWNKLHRCLYLTGKDKSEVIAKLYQRLRPDLNKKESVGLAIDLIRQAMNSTLTRQYDNFQWLSNGILP